MKTTLLLILLSVFTYAQQMKIHTQSGTDVYNLAEIDSITFVVESDTSGNHITLEWVTVPAGAYTYGEGDTSKTIDYDYYISKYEITNAQYVEYLEAALAAGDITATTSTVEGYYAGDAQWPSGTYEYLNLVASACRIDYDGSTFSVVSGYENHPVVEVTWFGSNAFAEHYGWSLPTEKEWEKAARGNTGYDYPWGEALDGSRANYLNSGDPFDNGTTPVGYYDGSNQNGFQTTDSPSPYGAYDMAGNVWEWTNSFYGASFSGERVLRGSGWGGYMDYLRSWARGGNYPTSSDGYDGFRVSRAF